MLRATKDIVLPTTITGSLPRPSWYTANIGAQSFMEAMVGTAFREQYGDTVSVYLHEQEIAGLDIATDGDAHFDSEVGGQSWTSYPLRHMGGFDRFNPQVMPGGGAVFFPPGHILHDYLESRVMPGIVGPVTRGNLQYAAIWKVAQRLTRKPVKFGTIGPELLAFAVKDLALQGHPRPHPRHRRGIEPGAARAGRRRLSGDPVRGAADSHAGCAQAGQRGHYARVQRRSVQSHGEGAARQDRSVVPHLLGQSFAAAHVRRRDKLQAGSRIRSTRSMRTSSPLNHAARAASTSRHSARTSPATRRSRLG